MRDGFGRQIWKISMIEIEGMWLKNYKFDVKYNRIIKICDTLKFKIFWLNWLQLNREKILNQIFRSWIRLDTLFMQFAVFDPKNVYFNKISIEKSFLFDQLKLQECCKLECCSTLNSCLKLLRWLKRIDKTGKLLKDCAYRWKNKSTNSQCEVDIL